MFAQYSGLGLLSKLSYELREQIWLEFLPVGQEDDEAFSTQTSGKADLRVLCTSRALYDEISIILYSRTCLHFDLSPSASTPSVWSTVYFKSWFQGKSSNNTSNKPAAWKLKSEVSHKDFQYHHRFENFPLHKIEKIEASLNVIDYEHLEHSFLLWLNVAKAFELLQAASSIPPLVIQLREGKAQDWCDAMGIVPNFLPDSQAKLNHELFILPFYNIRHLGIIKVEPHSEELKNKVDWESIDWATGVISKRNGDCETGIDVVGQYELWGTVFDNIFWGHDQIQRFQSRGSRSSRLDLLYAEWRDPGFGGFFKCKIKRNGRWIEEWSEVPILRDKLRDGTLKYCRYFK